MNLDFSEDSNLKPVKLGNKSDKKSSDLEKRINHENLNNGYNIDNLQILDNENCVISLSSKSPNSSRSGESGIQAEDEYEEEEISLIPEINFSGITALDSGIERESQPLLGREHSEITYNQFPGKFSHILMMFQFSTKPNKQALIRQVFR